MKEYRERAEECLRLAQETVDVRLKATLLERAQSWLLLYHQALRNSETDIVYETPPPRESVPQQQQQQQQRAEPDENEGKE